MPTTATGQHRSSQRSRARWSQAGAILLVCAALAACSNPPSAPDSASHPTAAGARASYLCTVSLAGARQGAAPTMSCATPGSASRSVGASSTGARDVVLGNQNTNVTLTFSSFSYNSNANIFSLNCVVTNLLAQPIGTTDGTTTSANGVRTFFTYGPFAAGGYGAVTVANASGTASFNGVTEPYFEYTPLIQPQASSSALTWRFNVPSTATGFTFRVEVDAPVPAQNSILRWLVLRQGVTGNQLTAAWRNTASDVWAVGNTSTILHYDGTQWSAPTTGLSAGTYAGVWGTSSTDVWVVGKSGVAAHYNGSSWSSSSIGSQFDLTGVWGNATTNYYATATSGRLYHYTATGWASVSYGTRLSSNLRAVWGADATHVFAVSDDGTVLMLNGTAWTTATPTTNALYAVWGTSATNVYAVGANGTILRYDGSTWTALTSNTTSQLNGVGGTSGTDVWAVGAAGVTLHSADGTTWQTIAPVVGLSINAVAAASSGPLWAVGTSGALLTLSGTSVTLSNQAGLQLLGVWASSPTDVWAAAPGTVLHYDGSNWTSAAVSSGDPMAAVWGTAANNVYAVGQQGTIAHYDGSAWSNTVIGSAGFNALYGASATDIYAVGTAGLVEHYDGTQWSAGTKAGTANLMGIWGAGSPATYIAVASDGTAYSSTNGGSWTAVSFSPSNTTALTSVFGSSGTNIWTTGNSGVAYVFAGSSFAQPSPANSTTTSYQGVWTTGASDTYLVGAGGAIEHYNGSGWLSMWSPVSTTLRSMYGTAAQNAYVAGDNGVVLLGTGS